MVPGVKVSTRQTKVLHISNQTIGSLIKAVSHKQFLKQIEKKSKLATEQDTIMQTISKAAVEEGRVGIQAKAVGKNKKKK